MPCSMSQRCTDCARLLLNILLPMGLPTLSVWPSTRTRLISGWSRSTLATFSRSANEAGLMIDELVAGSDLTRAAKNQHEKIAMTFACKGAIKAGQRLNKTEMQELFDRLFATELPYHDVHGRPTIVRLSKSELERKFGR